MKQDTNALKKLNELIAKQELQQITSLTIFELFSGLARSKKPTEEKGKIMEALKGQIVINLDSDAAEKSGEIDGNLIREGKTIRPIDCMIAGIALVKNEIILTRNLKDFSKIKGLKIESY